MQILQKMKWIVLIASLVMGAALSHAEGVTMNFKNADIRAFIEFVSGFSNKNFLIDNRVKEIGRASCRERVCLYV